MSMANCHSSGHRHFEKVAKVADPVIIMEPAELELQIS
jgi:hypothetical protein